MRGEQRDETEESVRARVDAAKRRYQDASAEHKRLADIWSDLGNSADGALSLRQAMRLHCAAAIDYSTALHELSALLLRRGRAMSGEVAGRNAVSQSLWAAGADLPRILVVDDETSVLHMVESMLRAVGCQVLTATGGREALAVIERRGRELALVLTDVVMRDLGGVAVAQACKAVVPPIPVLLMSGFTDGNTEGLPLIGKPFTPAALIDKVRAVLGAEKKPSRVEEQRAAEGERRTG